MTSSALERILCVENELDIQAVVQLALTEIGGYSVEMCGSGREALEAAPGFAPQLILLDVMMPKMDGISTLEALRKLPRTATTPVVFMTAKVQKEEIRRYLKAGAVDVIAKPFDPMTLSSTIEEIWERCRG